MPNGAAPSPATERFLASLAESGNLFLACHASNMTRRQITHLQRTNADFAAAYDEAMDEAADRIEAEAWRRGLEGVAEPLIKNGQVVRDANNEPIMTRRYSDPLLVLLLKGSKPNKYHTKAGQSPAGAMPSVMEEIAADDDPPRL
ncbi:hypothetical protein NFI95_04885 [Acetobacteraceae bacterium KSS8]|uniref:Terminase n=1 Tax=Endosaccharibacter trunci TaxID=2812733 RepID=A0ABT1W4V7_9PROT|nr:hypothetical protein [Acetobacteraceae bacterium KSS8]